MGRPLGGGDPCCFGWVIFTKYIHTSGFLPVAFEDMGVASDGHYFKSGGIGDLYPN